MTTESVLGGVDGESVRTSPLLCLVAAARTMGMITERSQNVQSAASH